MVYNINMSSSILTKEYIESLGYEVEEVDYRIFLVKNFLSKEEVAQLYDQAESADEESWSHHYMEGVRSLAKLKFGRDDIDNLVKEGLYEITDNWVDKNLRIADYALQKSLNERAQQIFNFREGLDFTGAGTIQRQYEGVPLKDHVDNHTDPSLEYAAVMYINDNYPDGEIFFVKQNIYLKPEPGSFLIFPTTEDWRHGVTAPGPGPTRYVIPCFIARGDFWKEHHKNNFDIEKTLKDTNPHTKTY